MDDIHIYSGMLRETIFLQDQSFFPFVATCMRITLREDIRILWTICILTQTSRVKPYCCRPVPFPSIVIYIRITLGYFRFESSIVVYVV